MHIISQTNNHLNPVVGSVDGLDSVKIGEVSEDLYSIFTEVDAFKEILHGGFGTSVAAVLLIMVRDCLRRFSYISPYILG